MSDAQVRMQDGELVLDDPTAVGVIAAIAKRNCRGVLTAQMDRVNHFKSRMNERGDSPADVMIILINVDDRAECKMMADALMPGMNWQPIRDRGETPYARGLCGRPGIQEVLEEVDATAARDLAGIAGIACVVMDHKTIAAFAV